MNCASARRRATRASLGASTSEFRADAATAWSLGVEDTQALRRQRIQRPMYVCVLSLLCSYFKEDNLGEGVYLDIIILTNSS